MRTNDIVNKAYKHYKCLRYEELYLSFDKQHQFFIINWHTFMDKGINMSKVKNVAKFVRKYSNCPIYYNVYG